MTLITRATDASVDISSAQFAPQIPGQTAGEALDAFAVCYIKQSDGKVWMSNATSANEAAGFFGMTAKAYASGDTNVTLFGLGTKFRYATGMTAGTTLYIGATAGRLNDAATTGDAVGVARAISSTVIQITRMAAGAVSGASLAAGTVTAAKAAIFFSSEQTGTGSAQNIAHGLGATPTGVIVWPTDLSPATVGQYVVTEGTHTSTNVVVTVTTSKKFKVFAWA